MCANLCSSVARHPGWMSDGRVSVKPMQAKASIPNIQKSFRRAQQVALLLVAGSRAAESLTNFYRRM